MSPTCSWVRLAYADGEEVVDGLHSLVAYDVLGDVEVHEGVLDSGSDLGGLLALILEALEVEYENVWSLPDIDLLLILGGSLADLAVHLAVQTLALSVDLEEVCDRQLGVLGFGLRKRQAEVHDWIECGRGGRAPLALDG